MYSVSKISITHNVLFFFSMKKNSDKLCVKSMSGPRKVFLHASIASRPKIRLYISCRFPNNPETKNSVNSKNISVTPVHCDFNGSFFFFFIILSSFSRIYAEIKTDLARQEQSICLCGTRGGRSVGRGFFVSWRVTRLFAYVAHAGHDVVEERVAANENTDAFPYINTRRTPGQSSPAELCDKSGSRWWIQQREYRRRT